MRKNGISRRQFVMAGLVLVAGTERLRAGEAKPIEAISIRTDLAADLPQVMADRVQLQQVFMNLMLNGIEAMKDMSAAGELTIKSQQAENGQLLISVSDTGVGLPPQQADQIPAQGGSKCLLMQRTLSTRKATCNRRCPGARNRMGPQLFPEIQIGDEITRNSAD